ncbi:MAG: hypothetical protein KDD84_24430, partial [Caldilineaceae bacterium]|nr:hypothetical protein [Caldilineaceae bacterium]
AIGAVGAIVVLFVHGLVDVALWGNVFAMLPWIVVSLSISLTRSLESTVAVVTAPRSAPDR